MCVHDFDLARAAVPLDISGGPKDPSPKRAKDMTHFDTERFEVRLKRRRPIAEKQE
jgi:hypothetical protein